MMTVDSDEHQGGHYRRHPKMTHTHTGQPIEQLRIEQALSSTNFKVIVTQH